MSVCVALAEGTGLQGVPAPRRVGHSKASSAGSSEARSSRGRSRGGAAVGNPNSRELDLQR